MEKLEERLLRWYRHETHADGNIIAKIDLNIENGDARASRFRLYHAFNREKWQITAYRPFLDARQILCTAVALVGTSATLAGVVYPYFVF